MSEDYERTLQLENLCTLAEMMRRNNEMMNKNKKSNFFPNHAVNDLCNRMKNNHVHFLSDLALIKESLEEIEKKKSK